MGENRINSLFNVHEKYKKVNIINSYRFGVSGINIANSTYSGNSFSVSTQTGTPRHLAFNPSGTICFMSSNNPDVIFQYNLTVGFDVTTMSYSGNSFSVSAQLDNCYGIEFNDDGTKFYGVNSTNYTIYEYNLSTAYDVTTMSYSGNSFSFTNQDINPFSFTFNNDGTEIYMSGVTNLKIFKYNLSTAYNVSTMSYSGVSYDFSTEIAGPLGTQFNNDGTQFFITSENIIFQYNLTVGWDITTASYSGNSFNMSVQDSSNRCAIFNTDYTKFFSVSAGGDKIYEYNL